MKGRGSLPARFRPAPISCKELCLPLWLFSLRAGASVHHVPGNGAHWLPCLTLPSNARPSRALGQQGKVKLEVRFPSGDSRDSLGLDCAAAQAGSITWATRPPHLSPPRQGPATTPLRATPMKCTWKKPPLSLPWTTAEVTAPQACSSAPRGETEAQHSRAPPFLPFTPLQCPSGAPRSTSTAERRPATRPRGAPTAAAWGRAAS